MRTHEISGTCRLFVFVLLTTRSHSATTKQDEEAAHLAKSLMSKKASRLYGRMQHGIAQKQARVDNLHKKRREIESTREKDPSGRTMLKKKVERLKKERREKEESYADTGGEFRDTWEMIWRNIFRVNDCFFVPIHSSSLISFSSVSNEGSMKKKKRRKN